MQDKTGPETTLQSGLLYVNSGAMIDPSDETMRLTSLRLAELHFAMLDFIMRGNPTTDRAKLVRAAVEQFVTAHENWDMDAFQDFAKSYAAKIKDADVRRRFLQTVKLFKAEAEAPQPSAFDLAPEQIASSPKDFDL